MMTLFFISCVGKNVNLWIIIFFNGFAIKGALKMETKQIAILAPDINWSEVENPVNISRGGFPSNAT